jgi:hypothetical protein
MNLHHPLARILWFIFAILTIGTASGQEKIALLVGLSEYPDPDWSKIHGARDAELLRTTLLLKGFLPENVATLLNSEATKQGIFKSIREQLIDRAAPGSHVFFLFSGHGQQMKDATPFDEIDGLDEAIVPYDARLQYIAGKYEGQNHIRDDELGYLFRLLRAKIGPSGSLTTVIDACHSGTGTRSLVNARGTNHIMAEESSLSAKNEMQAESGFNLTYRGKKEEQNLAPIYAFYGSGADELNYETIDDLGVPIGSLSFSFCKEFLASGAGTTYGSLFGRVKARMRQIVHRQTPQLEGEADAYVFGGRLSAPPAYFMPVRYLQETNALQLQAGQLAGFSDGSVVKVFSGDVLDTTGQTPLAYGTVQLASLVGCVVALDRPLSRQAAEFSKVFLSENGWGNLQARVQFDISDEQRRNLLVGHFAERQYLRRVWSNADLLFSLQPRNGLEFLSIRTADGLAVFERKWSVEQLDALLADVEASILDFARARFLRDLVLYDPYMRAEVELVPLTCTLQYGVRKEIGRIPLSEKINSNGEVQFRVGQDFARLKVGNTGGKAFYFTMVAIGPDGNISALLPEPGHSIADYQLPPGKSTELETIFEFGLPTGVEHIKFLLTDTPLDLHSLDSDDRTRSPEAEMHPFEVFYRSLREFIESQESRVRGITAPSLPAGSVVVGQVKYRVVE